MRNGIGLFLAGFVAALLTAPAAAAQVTQHDTGPTTGSSIAGGTFAPAGGAVAAAASPAVAAAVGAATTAVGTQLATGTITSATGAAIPAAAQAAVLGVLNGTTPPAQIAAALAAGGNPIAAAAVADAVAGLLSAPSVGQLATAIGQFNAMVLGSSDAFLANPPAEFLAIQSVLAQVSAAGTAAN